MRWLFIIASLLYSATAFSQELTKPTPWYENIIAESYGYAWFTDGDLMSKHDWVSGGVYGFSKLKYETDQNLHIIGGEGGYQLNLPFFKRITGGYEFAQGSSNRMHGVDVDPQFSDPGHTDFLGYLSYQKRKGRAHAKYENIRINLRPLEGQITKDISGYFGLSGSWIRYKDKVVLTETTDIIPGTSGTFASANSLQIRYEGLGVGARGGLTLFDMFKLEARVTYYPDMSVRQKDLWDVPINRKFVFSGSDASGLTTRVTVGFTPPIEFIRQRKHLEFEFGYQYMQFEQNGGTGRVYRYSDGAAANIGNWERAYSYRDGFFAGGTIRW